MQQVLPDSEWRGLVFAGSDTALLSSDSTATATLIASLTAPVLLRIMLAPLNKAESLASVFSRRQKTSSMDMMPAKEGAVPLNVALARIEEAQAAWSIPPLAEFAPITE